MTAQSGRPWSVIGRIVTVAIITAVIWGMAFLLLFVSPAAQPSVEIEVSSTSPGFSQMFFSDEDQVFSEERSVSQPVTQGDSTLVFPLKSWRGTVGSHIRWDPLDQPGEMLVTSAMFVGAGISEEIPLTGLRPSVGMGEITIGDEGAVLVLQSNDPQALIDADSKQFVELSRIRAILISSALTALALVLFAILLLRRPTGIRRRSRTDTSEQSLLAPTLGALTRIPTWVVATSSIIAISALGILIAGSQDIGVSWDEPGHEIALAEYFQSGWFVPRYLFVNGVPDTLAATVYAPVGWLLTHALGVFRGVHPWAVVPLSSDAFAARHLATALLAALALGAVLVIARVVFRSWRWAVLATAMLGSVPLFIGHGMFNTKDVAVASGFTLVTLGLVLLVHGSPRGTRWTWAGIAVTIGTALAIGTRPGVWVGLVVSAIAAIVVVAVIDARQADGRVALRLASGRGIVIVVAAAVAYGLLWFLYPQVFAAPGSLLATSLSASAEFSWSGETLTGGVLMPAQPPWTYLPVWLGAQLPLLISVATVVGLVALAVGFVGAWHRDASEGELVRGGIPIVMQALSVPIGAIVLGATLYGGIRQLLFILPAIALLATFGVYAVARGISHSRRRVWSTGLWIVVIVGLAVPTIAQIRLFPYSFAYFNAIAASRDINGNWDVDGWWLSARELVEKNPLPQRAVCAESSKRPVVDCRQLGVVAPFLPIDESQRPTILVDGYATLTRFETPLTNDKCRIIGEVVRPLFLQELRLSSIEECSVWLTPYPDAGIELSGAVKPDSQLLWGWNPYLLWGWGQPELSGVWTAGSEAGIGFEDRTLVNAAEQTRTLTVTGVFDVPDGGQRSVGVFVNGQQVGEVLAAIDAEPQTWDFTVPPSITGAVGEGRVIVEFAGLDDLIDDEASGVTGARLRLDGLGWGQQIPLSWRPSSPGESG